MANQSPDRRQVLEMLAKVAGISQFPGFSRWVYADQAGVPAQSSAPPYQPSFFDPAQYATIDRLTALIIPADDTPGAHEAGVAEFVDFMAAGDSRIQEPFRTGLAWLDQTAKTRYGQAFVDLTELRQVDLLRAASSVQGDAEGQKFFRLMREYTVMGYYTSRIGLQQLSYPGLRMYAQSPACPHKGNPDHLHLGGTGV